MAKILIVEDNDMNLDMLSRRLERKGYEIMAARDGQAGDVQEQHDVSGGGAAQDVLLVGRQVRVLHPRPPVSNQVLAFRYLSSSHLCFLL